MMSLSDDKQANIIDVCNTTSRYLNDILSITNIYFDNIVSETLSAELQLIIASTCDSDASFLYLHSFISDDIFSTKI